MEITRSAMRDLMVDGAIDVSNFDASWGGGPTEWRRVAQMAMSFGVEMGHHEEAQVRATCWRRYRTALSSRRSTPPETRSSGGCSANRPELAEGLFRLPDGPGFGWQLDDGFIKAFRADTQ